MKNPYSSIVIVIVALVVFASLAAAGPVPTWDKQINGPGRFKVLSQFNDEAVFDKETGLVWEQSPNTTERAWAPALSDCYQRLVGGRKGWRLPTIEELASLVAPPQPNPAPPAGHPFDEDNVQSSNYWSATTVADVTTNAWFVSLNSGNMGNVIFVWCVRGGQGVDGVP